jgi:hypothetical protein
MAKEIMEIHKDPVSFPSNKQKKWCKPPEGWLKMNSDGALHAVRGEGSWGYVIRDETGDVIAAGAGALSHIRDALQAEVHASIRGVQVASEKGITKIILETDSLILKQALQNDSHRLSEAGGDIYELKILLMSSFDNFVCVFVPRSCNKVAHNLAAIGGLCSQGGEVHWDCTPPDVSDLVASDIVEPLE